MNGKLPAAPLAGELAQIAAVLIILVTAIALGMTHHRMAVVALAVAVVAYATGGFLRNRSGL
jgi:hypothetical protein